MIKYIYEWFISKGRTEIHKIREEENMKAKIKRNGNGLKDGSGKGKGKAGGLRKNKTSKCRHPKK